MGGEHAAKNANGDIVTKVLREIRRGWGSFGISNIVPLLKLKVNIIGYLLVFYCLSGSSFIQWPRGQRSFLKMLTHFQDKQWQRQGSSMAEQSLHKAEVVGPTPTPATK